MSKRNCLQGRDSARKRGERKTRGEGEGRLKVREDRWKQGNRGDSIGNRQGCD